MWRTLASKLRDWLDRLLEEQEVRAAQEASTVDTAALLQGDSLTVAAKGQNDVESWSALPLSGPPEEWLRLVREGAPELLRSSDESQVPQSSPQEISVEEDDLQMEHSGAPVSYCEAPVPMAKEQRGKDGCLASETAVFRNRLLLSPPQRLRPTVVTREERAQKQGNRLPSEPARFATKPRTRPEDVRLSEYARAPEHAAIESERGIAQERRAGSLLPIVKEHFKKMGRAVFSNLLTGHAEPKKPTEAYSNIETPSQHFDAHVTHALSYLQPRSPSFESPSVDRSSNSGLANPQKSPGNIFGVRPVPGNWIPLPTRAMPHRNQKRSMTSSLQAESANIELPAFQTTNLHSFDSVQWPEPDQTNSWPELPEDPRLGEPNSGESLQSSDHVRLLELEQRGGR